MRGTRAAGCAGSGAEVGATACARALLSAGATLERDKNGDSPLHVAAVRGHVDCMKCLVLASKNLGGDTPRAADIRQALADAPPSPPVSDWIRYAYEDGTPYWYNPKTDESQWHEPGTAPPPEEVYDEPVFSPVPVEAPDAPAFSPVEAVAAEWSYFEAIVRAARTAEAGSALI
mgnify:CR=1 FL=1